MPLVIQRASYVVRIPSSGQNSVLPLQYLLNGVLPLQYLLNGVLPLHYLFRDPLRHCFCGFAITIQPLRSLQDFAVCPDPDP